MKKIIILLILLANISCSHTNKKDALKEKVSNLISAMSNNDVDKIYENLADEKDLEKVYLNFMKDDALKGKKFSFEGFKAKIPHLNADRVSYLQEIKRDFKENEEQWKSITPFAIIYKTEKGSSINGGKVFFKTSSDNIYKLNFSFTFLDNEVIIFQTDNDIDYSGKADELKERFKQIKPGESRKVLIAFF